MVAKINIALEDLKNQKQKALDNAEEGYCNTRSTVYRDNERYAWAVKTINEKYVQLEKDLIKSYSA